MSDLKDFINNNDFIVTNVSGSSMYPFLKDKSKVIISKIKNIEKYDVVLYKYNDKYVLHRVIDIIDNTYITKGDNHDKTAKIKSNEVFGVLVGYYKNNKYIEVDSKLNNRYYVISKLLLPFIKFKHLLRKII